MSEPSTIVGRCRSLIADSRIPALAALLLCLPILASDIPPVADLPQHLSQIALYRAPSLADDLMVAPWFYPNTLAYLPIYLLWQDGAPILTGKLSLAFYVTICVFATWALARDRQRSMTGWWLTLPLVYSAVLYWGFLNFLSGWPLFCLLLAVLARPPGRRQAIALAVCLTLLYYAHVLWFGVAAGVVMLSTCGMPTRVWIARASCLVPAGAMALAWYPKMANFRAAMGIVAEGDSQRHLLDRLDPEFLVRATIGGIPAAIETIVCSLIVAWIAVGMVQHRHRLRDHADRSLLIAASVLFVLYLALPERYFNTLLFAQRWLPFAAILLTLGCPAPVLPDRTDRLLRGAAILVTAAFVFVTAQHWRRFSEEDAAGLLQSSQEIHRGQRFIGLVFQNNSEHVLGMPMVQFPAWIELLSGARSNFSFAEHYSTLVISREPKPIGVARRVVSRPGSASKEDLRHFDMVLLGGDEETRGAHAARLDLAPTGGTQSDHRWRFYRVAN